MTQTKADSSTISGRWILKNPEEVANGIGVMAASDMKEKLETDRVLKIRRGDQRSMTVWVGRSGRRVEFTPAPARDRSLILTERR